MALVNGSFINTRIMSELLAICLVTNQAKYDLAEGSAQEELLV
jgi:hypothetical protein